MKRWHYISADALVGSTNNDLRRKKVENSIKFLTTAEVGLGQGRFPGG
jgi:hypothetical protein